ncbi:hypothetical protein FNW52_15110 [Flavobacterium sp. ZT3R18]|uniref:hypothetical protein n=1 Tax=Flavobacterium sp. ZT3R18 TaxID=2594429 RepID=UPI00117BB699|nr:hypothetical protein [Flavobacterium sp. ZT3R18]TRX33755.1 hypothetical protein FNW52_15110 [Flavobacterium sp. ZT3R18]
MKTFFKKYNTNDRRMFFLVVFVFFGFSSFAQASFNSTDLNVSVKDFNIATDELPVKTSSSATLNSNTNFILWFMGTKVGPSKSMSNEGIYTKNQIISTGTVPNHLLMKTLLKKTINLKFC